MEGHEKQYETDFVGFSFKYEVRQMSLWQSSFGVWKPGRSLGRICYRAHC